MCSHLKGFLERNISCIYILDSPAKNKTKKTQIKPNILIME